MVVGDIITLELGKQVPADCVLITSSDLSCNESAMTGEPDARKKIQLTSENINQMPCPFILKSSLIETGNGKALVCAVGELTQIGKTEGLLNNDQGMTPLQQKLERISTSIGLFGVAVAVLTFLALIIRGIIADAIAGDNIFTMDSLNGVLNAFILGVTIVVVAVPEGLPLAVTISLAYSVGQMFKENNLVRRLHASETMGGANEICTDKTGTLTQNKMTVMAVYEKGEIRNTGGKGDASVSDLLTESILYNCSAHVETENGKQVSKGNVTECGIIDYLLKSNAQVEETLAKREATGFVEFMIPFSSSRKRATSAIRNPRLSNEKVSVFCKGAPEIVIDLCTRVID